jgi:hypothetical protein
MKHDNRTWCLATGKTRHATKKSALGSASVSAKHNSIVLFVYKCGHCRDFHLTKRARNVRKTSSNPSASL